MVRQLRVDGVAYQLLRKDKKRVLEWVEEAWSCRLKKYEVEQIPYDSRTQITIGCFHPVYAEVKEPQRSGAWEDHGWGEYYGAAWSDARASNDPGCAATCTGWSGKY